MDEKEKFHVVVIVLGDLGRSPRMQYHAVSLSEMKDVIKRVTVIGYAGEETIPAIRQNCHDNICVHRIGGIEKRVAYCAIEKFLSLFSKIPLLFAVFKGLYLLLNLVHILSTLPHYDMILIQNPPCLPVVISSFLVSYFKNGSTIIIDWHNLGFSMYKDRLGERHILVQLSRFLERIAATAVDAHICVSKALSTWLQQNFKISAHVIYDRPASIFSNSENGISLQKRHHLLSKLNLVDSELFPELYIKQSSSSIPTIRSTIQTQINGSSGEICLRRDRCPILISSTSWTPDENFDLLLDALIGVEKNLQEYADDSVNKSDLDEKNINRLAVLVTGKGPLKLDFERKIRQLGLKRVGIKTLWLEPEDYPLIMSCADLGVCLHTSTSGLDLPMKILDMFGCGVPVLAINFATLPELVHDKKNGLIFSSSLELQKQLTALFFPKISLKMDNKLSCTLNDLKNGTLSLDSWDKHWQANMKPIISSLLESHSMSRNRKKRKVLFFFGILLTLLASFVFALYKINT